MGYKLEHLEEINGLAPALGTLPQVFIEDLHYFRADSTGPDFVTNQVDKQLSTQEMLRKIHGWSLTSGYSKRADL